MKKIALGIVVLLLLAGASSVAAAKHVQTEKQMAEITQDMGFDVLSFERHVVSGDIAEYKFVMKVGSGDHDIIGIHRVVREEAPWRPIKTDYAEMMIHGDAVNFSALFLPSTISAGMPVNQSPAIYHAEEGIDVWGIDHRYTFVPEGLCDITDCGFMAGWNTSTRISDIRTAMELAGKIRKSTGSPDNGFFLLGLSRGGQDVYAYSGWETTQRKKLLRGILPGDIFYKFAPETTVFYCLDYTNASTCGTISAKQAAAIRYNVLKSKYDNGVYYSNEGAFLRMMSSLAKNAPDNQSQFFPGLTNWEALMTVTAATYATFQPPEVPYVSFYHYNAGVMDARGVFIGLRFTDPNSTVDISQSISPYQSIGEGMDGEAIAADIENPYDDHLGNITLPLYYWGAGGGMGPEPIYTLQLLGSQDKTINIVSLIPERPFDFGHGDLPYSSLSRDLVWKPQAQWIKNH